MTCRRNKHIFVRYFVKLRKLVYSRNFRCWLKICSSQFVSYRFFFISNMESISMLVISRFAFAKPLCSFNLCFIRDIWTLWWLLWVNVLLKCCIRISLLNLKKNLRISCQLIRSLSISNSKYGVSRGWWHIFEIIIEGADIKFLYHVFRGMILNLVHERF